METNSTQRAVVACSFFLYTGHIGAATVAAGLIQVFAGATSGLGLVVFGGILATASWCRAWTSVKARNRASVVKTHLPRRIGERHPMAARHSGQPVSVRLQPRADIEPLIGVAGQQRGSR